MSSKRKAEQEEASSSEDSDSEVRKIDAFIKLIKTVMYFKPGAGTFRPIVPLMLA